MPLGGGGVWERTPGTRIANQGALVSAQVNDETDNLLAGINAKVSLSGVLPFTGLQLLFGDGTAALHGATVQQAQKHILNHSTAVAGTADAIQITMSPASTTWTLNETVRWKSSGANTITAPTISKDAGSSTKILKKGTGVALAVGDTGASGYECEGLYNGTDVILKNPAVVTSVGAATESVAGITQYSSTAQAAAQTHTTSAVTPAGLAFKPEAFIIAVSDETTAITTGVAKVTFRMPYAFTLTSVKASLTTASSSGIPTVDINEGGTTILSTKLTIDASELTSATAATAAVISDATLAADASITFDIDVAGTGAKGLKVYMIGHQ